MLYSCFPETGEDLGFDAETEWCHGMIFRYKGVKKESWRNVARKAIADMDVMGSKEGVWHHFTYFPEKRCAIGLRKTEHNGPPVISTPDVYVSNVCFEDDGVTLKEACQMCTCENSEACPKFTSTREPLGDVRLDIMNRLRDAPIVDLKESNDPPREKRLEVTSSRFSYGAHFMPKMTHSTNYDVNCNLFNKMWMNNPAKINEYINGGGQHEDPGHSADGEFVGISVGGPLRVESEDTGSDYYSSDEEDGFLDDHHRFLRLNKKKHTRTKKQQQTPPSM